MDDTNTSRGTDASAAATRKRRSSILKSQRPPRTPFSELEFNVATPTDTGKSRRVSFSKRTGVAEFVTNEATTTWKNFYEEHNKSMESSGNDSEMHPARAVVSLGKKIFDQQFEEVEAIDLLTTMDNRSGLNMNHSIQNVNFAPFEMTAASLDKLTAPKTKFELSTFTDHQSKMFGDDLALTNMEVSEGMDINFSNVQPLSEGDDLDEIEKDIGRVQSNVICHGPFNMRDMSGYIEVDLNMTHVVLKEDESDMSITNSVHIPKVDDLSKSMTLDKNESNKDWLIDKENIAINPYATPRETDNFAINKESDKVLVFDGKRLTIQSEKEELKSNRHTMLPNPITIKDHRKTITLNTNDDLPNFFDANEALNSENISYAVPAKTIQKHNMSIINDTKLQTVLYDDGMDISITQALPTNIAIHDMTKNEKQRTIVFGKDTGNISITQAVPVSKIVFDNDANISLTEAVPSNIILNIENKAHAAGIEGSNAMCMSSNIKNNWIDNKKTIVYENNDNISITQTALGSILPPNLKAGRRQTVVFDDDGNMSMTQAMPNKILSQEQNKKTKNLVNDNDHIYSNNSNFKLQLNDLLDSTKDNRRQTMVFGDDGNMSMTQTIPNKILSQKQIEKRKSTLCDNDNIYSKSTESDSKPEGVNGSPHFTKNYRRQTMIFEDDGNMSMTQAIPNKILSQEQAEKRKSAACDHDNFYSNSTKSDSKLEVANGSPDSTKNNRRQTMIFEDDGNMSMTQAIPNKILSQEQAEKRKSAACDPDNFYSNSTKSDSKLEVANGSPDSTKNNRRQTMIFEDDGNMSMTQAIPNNILSHEQAEKRKSTACDHVNFYSKSANNHSVSEVVNSLPDSTKTNKRQTMLFSDDGNMSITQAIPNKIISQEQVDKSNSSSKLVTVNELTYTKNNKRQTIVFDDDVGDISITRALPTNILNTDVSVIITDKSIRREQMTDEDNTENISKKEVSSRNVILKNAVKQDNNCNISMASSSADNVGQSGRSKNQCAIGNHGNDALSLLKDNSYMNLSQGKCHKHNTIQSDNTIGGTLGQTSINMLINDNSQVIVDGNEDELEVDQHRFNQSKHKENISNISKTLNNLAHVSNKFSNCQEIVGGDSETKCNSSVYIPDVSVNLECDISATKTLSDGIQNCKGNNESHIKLTTINNSPQKDVQRNCTEHDTSINQYFKKHVNLKAYILDDCIKTAVKPIPMELSTTQHKIIKSEDNKVDSTVMEHIHQNVLVYQSFTNSVSQLQLKRTEQGDVKSDRTLNQCDEKSDSSTIVIEKDDIKSNVDADKKSIAESKISTITFNKEEADVEMADIDKSVSILDELLDMSMASLEGGLDDKYCTAKVESPHDSVVSMKKSNVDNTSNESMFYITQDSDGEAQTEMSRKGSKGNETPNIDTSPLPLEYKEQQPYILQDVQNTLEKVKAVSHDSKNSSPQNRHYEKVVSADVNVEDEKLKERLSIAGRSFKTADDTNDLLKLLSDFTDKKGSDYIEEEDEEQREPIVVKGHIAIENKSELEPKRLSFAPNRQSIVISREDLLNNISMAHATLQKSRYELDLSDSIEDTKESLEESCHKKSVRISNEVVKALHFDDDTTSELSIKSELKLSPLKKTAFGETSYMKETKANVIPTYLKDVSDNIKALMSDLVKPVQDVMPFDVRKSDKGVRRSNSTCSTQVQANLITSSQIDLESNINSDHQLPQQIDSTNTLINSIANSGNQAIEHALKSALKSPRPVEKYSDMDVESADESFNQLSVGRPTSGQYVSDRVLIFDQNNPLNNVLLAPPDLTEVHRYNPKKSTETICFSERSDSAQISVHDTENEYNADRVSAQYLVKTSYIVKQGGDTCRDSPVDTSSIASNISKPMSIDESTDVKPIDVKHMQVNTMIAMKGTKQLLEASSSLTLVDDALARPEFDINLNTNTSSQDDVSSKNLQNPVKTIFKNDIGDNTHKVESDITSNDEETEPMQARIKKRVYSPANIDKHKNCTLSSLDLTPRPFSKMQKISETPRKFENNDIDERPVKESKVKKSASKPIQERKTSPKKKNKKPGTSVTVQQLLTEYNMQVDEDTTVKSESTIPVTISKSDEEGRSVDMISSFTSSKNLNEINNRSVSNTVSNTVSTISKCSKSSRVEWQPEFGDYSSKNQIAECDASVNVVAKIDMLPFMGSRECEWESCSGDTWCFRLLHARLRLVVRLAHRHENAARTRVAAHTPVLAVTVHVAHQDRCGSVASACVRLAAAAMRRAAGGACACAAAGAVPALLGRCGAVARAALRWGRAMHDARARLAYTLTDDDHLSLKVANVALRSVWEVTMRLELAVDEATEAPWPRAADVRVTRVVSDYKVTEEEVLRALRHVPHDWGHVPRTVWRIFKYLKHKTRSDELLDM